MPHRAAEDDPALEKALANEAAFDATLESRLARRRKRSLLRSRSSANRRPALHRLERCGWITATWRTTGNSRRAKYYELTRAGQKQLQSASDSWRRLAAVVGDVLDLAWIPLPSCARSNGGGGVLSLARRRPPGGNGSILVLARRLRHKTHAWLTGHKLMTPGWSRSGQPLRAWTAAGFLNSTSGPLAPLLQRLGQPPAIAWVDLIVPLSLLLIGVSMMLGVFTRISYWAAVLFLALVYLASIPTSGLPAPAAEGTYLLVNKNLIEALAVLVLIAFETRRGAPVATRTAAVASERVA